MASRDLSEVAATSYLTCVSPTSSSTINGFGTVASDDASSTCCVPGLWDLHLPCEDKVGPQARLPSPETAQRMKWILEVPPPVNSEVK